MFLPASGAEFYTLAIATTPALTGWEASFDDGTSWVAGAVDVDDPTVYRWLVSGPSAGVVDDATALAGDVQPLIRATSNPEVIVRKAPYIAITTPDA